MAKLVKSVTIHAPVDKVFNYLTEPTNLPEIWPSMVEVKDIQRLPDGKTNYHWKYKMAGMFFEGDTETVELVANQRVVAKNESGIPSTFVWTYQPEDGDTKVTMEVEYTVPVPVLGKLAEAAVVKLNDHEADTLLANLKTRVEGNYFYRCF